MEKTVKGVLKIESPYWKKLNIVDIENYVVCYTGTMNNYTKSTDMSDYRKEVDSMVVYKATTNGNTLNLFVQTA